YGFFQTADGHWVSLGVREEKFERSLAAALALDFPLARPSVVGAIGARPWAELERAFGEHDVPYALAADPRDLLQDPTPGGLGDLFVDGHWTLGVPGLQRWVGGEGDR